MLFELVHDHNGYHDYEPILCDLHDTLNGVRRVTLCDEQCGQSDYLTMGDDHTINVTRQQALEIIETGDSEVLL